MWAIIGWAGGTTALQMGVLLVPNIATIHTNQVSTQKHVIPFVKKKVS